MQQLRAENRVTQVVLGVGGLVAVAAGVVAWQLGHRGTAFVAVVAGLLSGSLCFGVWLVGRMRGEQVAAMRAGELFGSWGGRGSARVDVGAQAAVVDGEVRLYDVHFRRALRVEHDPTAGEVRVHFIANDGNGERERAFSIPFGPADADTARECATRLAGHHGVDMVEA